MPELKQQQIDLLRMICREISEEQMCEILQITKTDFDSVLRELFQIVQNICVKVRLVEIEDLDGRFITEVQLLFLKFGIFENEAIICINEQNK